MADDYAILTASGSTGVSMKKDYTTFAFETVNKGLVNASGALSIIGCLFTFMTYVAYKDLQTSSRHLMVCISIADFMYTTVNVIAVNFKPHSYKKLCIIQSFIGSTFVLCSFLWTGSLAVFLYITIVKGRKELADRLIWPWFHLICWLVPLAINLVAINLNVLGNSGDRTSAGWCWINVEDLGRRDSTIWMFVDGKAVEILTYVVVFIFYILVRRHLQKEIKCTHGSGSMTSQFVQPRTLMAAKNADRKMILVPICFLLVRIWGTIRFFFFVWRSLSETAQHVLLHFQSVGDNLQGFVNFLLFCVLTKKVRNRLKDSFRNCFKKPATENSQEEPLIYDME